MSFFKTTLPVTTAVMALLSSLMSGPVAADGVIGEHVNDLQGHLDEYTGEVAWLIGKVSGVVDTYAARGVKAAQPEAVVDHWEEVQFHSAIETYYIPLYASIWQGLYGVRQGIEERQPVSAVRAELAKLEAALWQALGALKVAAEFQARGMLPPIEHTEAGSPVETLDIIKRQLHRVVAKYAEKSHDKALTVVQQTYLTRFEAIEGDLIAFDADLVEDLELDFNVKLPQAIEGGKSVDEVRDVVDSMQGKLDRCRELLVQAESKRGSVF